MCWRRTQTAGLGWARGTCLWAEKRPQPSPQTDRRLFGPWATRHDTRLASFVFITAVSISTDKKLVYAGTNTGALRVYEWPSAGRRGGAPFSELQALSAAVTDLRESPSGFCITSAGEDGSILVYTILKGHSTASC